MPHDRASTRTSGRRRGALSCLLALLAFTGLALAGCGAGGVSPTLSSSPAASASPSVAADGYLLSVLQETWAGYKQGFIDAGGRVSDPTRGGVTTSEGQSYALLRAVWMDDRASFATVWGWTRANLQVRGDGLFASLWSGGAVQDHNSASDADSDIALALLFAAHRFADSTGVLRAMWAMRRACRSSYSDSFAALRVWFALSWVVTLACIRGLVQKQAEFLRTPKSKERGSLLSALRASRAETLLTIAATAGGVVMVLRSPSFATVVLGVLLFFEAFVYSNAPWASMAAEGIILTPERRAYARSPQNTGDRPARRGRELVPVGLTALAVAAAIVAVVASSPSDRAPFSGPQQDLPRIGSVAPKVGAGPTPTPSAVPTATPTTAPTQTVQATPTRASTPTAGTSPSPT